MTMELERNPGVRQGSTSKKKKQRSTCEKLQLKNEKEHNHVSEDELIVAGANYPNACQTNKNNNDAQTQK